MSETNAQRIARLEIKGAVENLLKACQNNHAAFVGFVWGVDPSIIMRFGNVKETGAALTDLFLRLEDIVNQKSEAGLIKNDPLQGTQASKPETIN